MQAGRRRETKGRERRHRRRRHCFTRNFLRHSLARSGLNDGKYAQIERGKEGKQQPAGRHAAAEGREEAGRAAVWKKCKHGARCYVSRGIR